MVVVFAVIDVAAAVLVVAVGIVLDLVERMMMMKMTILLLL